MTLQSGRDMRCGRFHKFTQEEHNGERLYGYGVFRDPEWEMKYIRAHRPDTCVTDPADEGNQDIDHQESIPHTGNITRHGRRS